MFSSCVFENSVGVRPKRDRRALPSGILGRMTRITFVVGLCVLGIVGVASAAPSEFAGKRAQLHVVSMQPLTVRGAGFVPGERVNVLVAAGGEYEAKTKVATDAGVFKVKFQASLGTCRGYYMVRAYGSRGSRAHALTRLPQLDCVGPDRGRTDRSTTTRAPGA